MPSFIGLSLSDVSDMSQIVIAVANLFLVVYIFIYTRQKDQDDILRNLKLQEQNTNLQWFKELIIQPHFPAVLSFYDQITLIAEGLLVKGIDDSTKITIADNIKESQAKIRKSFVDILRVVDPKLELRVKTNLDTLIGDLTIAIFDKEINLEHGLAFEKEIINKIIYSKNDLISIIYGFNGNKLIA
jgi:hypothetical protein